MTKLSIDQLKQSFTGDLAFDRLHQTIYATDASVYRMLPLGVAYPKNISDIQRLIAFARDNAITLIPRAAGTSLAGQCVGEGLVVDISRYFTGIGHLDKNRKTITVQPGVIRDELNAFLKPHGLFFGPNTSTANRCTIGGMVGNNSSGTTSIKYGVTRDKLVGVKAVLSDGSLAEFTNLSKEEFEQKTTGETFEHKIYSSIDTYLSRQEVRDEIVNEFPKPSIHRRSTGYAVDALVDTDVYTNSSHQFNLSKLLCGSEGTLAFSTEITLQLDDLPPQYTAMVTAHFTSVQESLQAVLVAMKHDLYTCELMDKTILDCTVNNREQAKNRAFVEGDPQAILMLELKSDDPESLDNQVVQLIADLKTHGFGYAYPVLRGEDIKRALTLRKAGLGLLGNIIGDDKAVACIEDTAVELSDLPDFIAEFTAMMNKYEQKAVYYAHAGAGELHLRPILNLKKETDVVLFRTITTEVAQLVKKYRGSFSGEHGDGIVRAEFLPELIGENNYKLLKEIKTIFDPYNVFNKGKIVEAYPMDKHLRYQPDREEPVIETIQDFSDQQGILRLAEKCNGSGDCRKPVFAGGTMCPSYRATREEKDTTRARANTLREFLTHSDKANRFDHKELKEVFDLCLSCKACAGECPSSVDVAALKAEFLYQYQKTHRPSLRTHLFAHNIRYNRLGSIAPWLTNLMLNSAITKSILKIAKERSIPKLYKTTLKRWVKKNLEVLQPQNPVRTIYLFVDEFTNFYDVNIGIDTVKLLTKLNYRVLWIDHEESGRSFISKGYLAEAKKVVDKNVYLFKDLITEQTPLVGTEPSAILSLRDEYLRLADDKVAARSIAKHTMTIEEFIAQEYKSDRITTHQFTNRPQEIKIHVHCQQKSLSSSAHTFTMLNIPENYKPVLMSTGCCGMAGSFGYEKEHYKVSMQVGEDTLFPKVRAMGKDVLISASGTSCRHQIHDGTKRESKHPVTILKEALV